MHIASNISTLLIELCLPEAGCLIKNCQCHTHAIPHTDRIASPTRAYKVQAYNREAYKVGAYKVQAYNRETYK